MENAKLAGESSEEETDDDEDIDTAKRMHIHSWEPVSDYFDQKNHTRDRLFYGQTGGVSLHYIFQKVIEICLRSFGCCL